MNPWERDWSAPEPEPAAKPWEQDWSAPAPAAAPPEPAAPAAPTGFNERAHVALGGFLEGIPIVGPTIRGRLDRLGAGIRSVASGTSFDEELAFVQRRSRELSEEHPALDIGGQIAGGVATMGPLMAAAPAAFGLTQASRLSRAAVGATSGAAIGAADTAARGGDPRVGAAVGGAFGALAPAVGGMAGRFWSNLRGPKAPTVEQLSQQARTLYDKASKAGVKVAAPSWSGVVDDIAGAAKDAGLHPALHPRTSGVLKHLTDSKGGELTLDQVETLRRVLKGAASSIEPDERRIARVLVEKLDDWQLALGAKDVVAGDATAASSALREARQLWGRAKKGEIIGEMIEKAGITGKSRFTQSGFENALRAEFRSLARNSRKMRTFSPAEREAIKRVAEGGPLGNAMRYLGKFAPTSALSAVGGPGLAAAVGFVLGGPAAGGAAAAGAVVLGSTGRKLAEVSTSRAARLAQDLMLRGRVLPPSPGARAFGGAATLGAGLEVGRSMPLQVDIRDDDIPGPNPPRRQ